MISQLYSDDKIYYVFSFVANHDKQNVLDIMSERKSKCYFAPYSPDCFAQISDENADMIIMPDSKDTIIKIILIKELRYLQR